MPGTLTSDRLVPDRLARLDGAFAGGHCAMEVVVAWLAGEGHTDPAVTR